MCTNNKNKKAYYNNNLDYKPKRFRFFAFLNGNLINQSLL